MAVFREESREHGEAWLRKHHADAEMAGTVAVIRDLLVSLRCAEEELSAREMDCGLLTFYLRRAIDGWYREVGFGDPQDPDFQRCCKVREGFSEDFGNEEAFAQREYERDFGGPECRE